MTSESNKVANAPPPSPFYSEYCTLFFSEQHLAVNTDQTEYAQKKKKKIYQLPFNEVMEQE